MSDEDLTAVSTGTAEKPMSLVEHLEELRKRIIISLVALVAGMTLCFIFKTRVLSFLIAPLGGKELITLSPTESFMTVFKVAGYGGLIIASPVIIYQLWAFISPGLRKKERHVALLATFITSLLFLVGIVFAWYVVLPRGLDFLLNYEGEVFNQQIQASRYFSFVAMFLLGFGLIFELPAMLITLSWVGVVDARTLAKKRRYALLIGALVSAILTPGQDLFSMIAMFIPFILLYEVSILFARVIQRRRDKREAEERAREGAEEAAELEAARAAEPAALTEAGEPGAETAGPEPEPDAGPVAGPEPDDSGIAEPGTPSSEPPAPPVIDGPLDMPEDFEDEEDEK